MQVWKVFSVPALIINAPAIIEAAIMKADSNVMIGFLSAMFCLSFAAGSSDCMLKIST